jgi:hypothetical protein
VYDSTTPLLERHSCHRILHFVQLAWHGCRCWSHAVTGTNHLPVSAASAPAHCTSQGSTTCRFSQQSQGCHLLLSAQPASASLSGWQQPMQRVASGTPARCSDCTRSAVSTQQGCVWRLYEQRVRHYKQRRHGAYACCQEESTAPVA